jgi:hypothetical protein
MKKLSRPHRKSPCQHPVKPHHGDRPCAGIKPPLRDDWEYREGELPNTGLPKIPAGVDVPAWGPAGDAKQLPEDLSDAFLAVVTENTLEKVAKWTNEYATAPVKVVRRTQNWLCKLGAKREMKAKWKKRKIFG